MEKLWPMFDIFDIFDQVILSLESRLNINAWL